jgi:hypothetical protein
VYVSDDASIDSFETTATVQLVIVAHAVSGSINHIVLLCTDEHEGASILEASAVSIITTHSDTFTQSATYTELKVTQLSS